MGHAITVGWSSCASDSSKCILEPHSHTEFYANTHSESNGHSYTHTDTDWNSHQYGDSYRDACTRFNSIELGHTDSYTEPHSVD